MVKAVRFLVLVAGSTVPALFLALILYARFFTEGWGAFGLAPLVLPIAAASAVVVVLGIPVWIARLRSGLRDIPLAAVIIANGVLLLMVSQSHGWF